MQQNRLENKVILVTGASRGIGRAVAIAAGSQGAEVILTGRTTGALEEVDDQIHALGVKSVIVELDQTGFASDTTFGKRHCKQMAKIRWAVANAGQLVNITITHSDDDVFDRTIQVNLTSIFHMIKAFDGLAKAHQRLVALSWCHLARRLAIAPSGAPMPSQRLVWRLWGGLGRQSQSKQI